MPTSVYTNNQNATREQFLVEDLIIESIKLWGIDIYYIPRTSQSILDQLFGDDPVKYFDRAYKIDMYLETYNEYEGQQEFFSKFGLNIDKTAKVAVARRTFERFVPSALRNTPKEGDLIFMPIQQKLLEIRQVEEEKNFFQLGKSAPYMYGLSIETFKYNGEFLNTGIEEVDSICDNVAPSVMYDVTTNANTSVSYERGEAVYQGANTATATAKGIVAEFDRVDLKLRLRNIKGTFTNSPAIGAVTGANFTISTYDAMDNATRTYDDNTLLETEADNILDFTESNPFGEP